MKKLYDILWKDSLKEIPQPKKFFMYVLRFIYVLARDIGEGQLTLRSMSLVYTTLLSIVPLLALSFSMLKSFGIHNQMEPMLLGIMEPLGEKGIQITHQIIGFVENMNVGVLGAAGLGILLYTVISLVQKIEVTFNYIWHIKKARPLAQRFSGYLSIILTTPILIFSAIGISGAVMEDSLIQQAMGISGVGFVVELIGRLVPFFISIAVFSMLYILIPNTKVRIPSALFAGVLTSLLWKSISTIFASFASSTTQYDAVYSGFAVIIIFMIWLYLNWAILLLGASIAFYHQNPKFITRYRQARLNFSTRETLCFNALSAISKAYYADKDPLTAMDLALACRTTNSRIMQVLTPLEKAHILTRTESGGYIPLHAPETITLSTIWQVQRGGLGKSTRAHPTSATIEDAVIKALKGKTLKDI
jgi:membrane protein